MAWIKANWYWLVIVVPAVLAALVTGLSPYPKAKGLVTFFQIVLDFFSVVTHKDSPKSLKLPFTRSKPPAGQMRIKLWGPPVPVSILFVTFLAFTVTSCCIFKPGTCKSAFGNCAAEKIRAEFPDVENVVEAVLSGSEPEIVMKSLKLLEGLGVGLVVCTVQAVEAKHAATTQPTSGPAKMAVHPKVNLILKNADAYLKLKGARR